MHADLKIISKKHDLSTKKLQVKFEDQMYTEIEP